MPPTRGSLVQHVYTHLKQRTGRELRQDRTFHPSELAGAFCPRRWVLRNYHPEAASVHAESVQLDQARRFAHGHAVHYKIQSILAESGILWGRWSRNVGSPEERWGFTPGEPGFVYAEVPVNHDAERISGRIDGLVRLNGRKFGIEIKSVNSYRAVEIQDEPLDHHREQVLIYMHCLSWMHEQKRASNQFLDDFDREPIAGFLVLYENTDSLVLKECVVRFNASEIAALIARKRKEIREALAFEQSRQLPPCRCEYQSDAALCATLGARPFGGTVLVGSSPTAPLAPRPASAAAVPVGTSLVDLPSGCGTPHYIQIGRISSGRIAEFASFAGLRCGHRATDAIRTLGQPEDVTHDLYKNLVYARGDLVLNCRRETGVIEYVIFRAAAGDFLANQNIDEPITAFVGRSRTEIESVFGSPASAGDRQIAYTHENEDDGTTTVTFWTDGEDRCEDVWIGWFPSEAALSREVDAYAVDTVATNSEPDFLPDFMQFGRLSIGDSEAHVRSALGPPDRTRSNVWRSLSYGGRKLTIRCDAATGVVDSIHIRRGAKEFLRENGVSGEWIGILDASRSAIEGLLGTELKQATSDPRTWRYTSVSQPGLALLTFNMDASGSCWGYSCLWLPVAERSGEYDLEPGFEEPCVVDDADDEERDEEES